VAHAVAHACLDLGDPRIRFLFDLLQQQRLQTCRSFLL
jgi:hypothetical protein